MAGIHHVSFTISPAPGVLNDFISVIFNSLNTAAEIARIVTPQPHAAPVNLQFNNLDPGIYLVEVHDTPGGGVLGNMRHDFWVDARTNAILFERRFYVVDAGGANDPVAGTTAITDSYFNGKTISGVFQEGYRYIKPTVEWAQAGATLNFLNDLNSGSQITNNNGQVWTVEIMYTIIQTGGSTKDEFTDIIDIITNTALGSTEYGKVLMVAGATSKVFLLAPFLGTIPDGTGFMVVHNGGSVINVQFALQSGEVIRFRGADVNYIYLAKGEFIKMIKKGTKLYVVDYRGQWDRIGEMVNGDIQIDNSLVFNGAQYDGNVYPRIYEWIRDVLPLSQKVSPTDWVNVNQVIRGETVYTKRMLYAIDTSVQSFIVPDRRNLMIRAVKNIGGADITRVDNVPGGYQHDEIRTTIFYVTIGPGQRANSASGSGKVAVGGDASEGADIVLPATIGTGLETHPQNIASLPLLLI